MCYIVEGKGHNNLGYISSLFQPLQTFFGECLKHKVKLPTRGKVSKFYEKRKYKDILTKKLSENDDK